MTRPETDAKSALARTGSAVILDGHGETRRNGVRKRRGELECAAKDAHSLAPTRTQHGGGRSQSDLKSAEFPNKNRRRSLKARGLNSRCVEICVFNEERVGANE